MGVLDTAKAFLNSQGYVVGGQNQGKPETRELMRSNSPPRPVPPWLAEVRAWQSYPPAMEWFKRWQTRAARLVAMNGISRAADAVHDAAPRDVVDRMMAEASLTLDLSKTLDNEQRSHDYGWAHGLKRMANQFETEITGREAK